MDDRLTIEPYSERRREAQKDFALKMWPHKRRRHAEAYLRWKFRGPAQGDVDGLLLALAGERVIGQIGAIPVNIRVEDEMLPAQWICDLMGDPQATGKWVGVKLMRQVSTYPRISLASNPSHSANGVARRIRVHTLSGPQIMLLPLRLNHLLGWKVPPRMRSLIPLLAQIGRPLVTWRSRKLRRPPRAVAVRRCSWGELVPLIGRRQQQLSCPHVIHDQDFFSWRCHPPEGFAAKSFALATEAGGYALLEVGLPYFYVMEWFAPGQADFFALFQAILALALEAGCQTIQALAQDDRETAWLMEAGFLKMRHRVNIICYTPKTFTHSRDKFHYWWNDSDGNL